jgi:hypothetical protein
MRDNEDKETVDSFDLLVPGFAICLLIFLVPLISP